MSMEPRDVDGILYSAGGLRFGGFQTSDFIDATEQLEQRRPGVREEIVGEAHYLVHWLHQFPGIVFFLAIIFSQSVWIALLLFVAAFVLEIIRFYIFGSSLFSPFLCRVWRWIKYPLFIIAAVVMWSENTLLSITLLVFVIIQGCFGLLSIVGMLPLKLTIAQIMAKKYGSPHWCNMEGMAMTFVINSWRQKLFPADKSNIDGKSE